MSRVASVGARAPPVGHAIMTGTSPPNPPSLRSEGPEWAVNTPELMLYFWMDAPASTQRSLPMTSRPLIWSSASQLALDHVACQRLRAGLKRAMPASSEPNRICDPIWTMEVTWSEWSTLAEDQTEDVLLAVS